MSSETNSAAVPRQSAARSATRDIFTGIVVLSALMIFIGSSTSVLRSATDVVIGLGGGADRSLRVALLLNIALILFGWRRYRDLQREVVDRTAAEERAHRLALHDPLTGFHNRRSLSDAGMELLMRTTRRGKLVAMVMFDLDHFKTVNDLHGHATGDALLRAVASEMTRLLPPSGLAARLGGDEFACAFAFDREHPDVVDRIVSEIVSRLAQPFDADGIFTHITVSAGIAHSAPDCDTIEALMRRADIAMYAAKRQGRNRQTWFDASMERDLQARNELESNMRAGIKANQFEPYFEQQIELATGQIKGFEVLARWQHPTMGLVLPDRFIPVAEETGMIGDLSLSVIYTALSAARDWDPSLVISVNISPTQLRDPWLAQKIVKLLVETRFPADRLEIEITETSLFDNLPVAQSIIASLKNQGIRLALDDFGTGYSSLAHLRSLPFDKIKIDKSFVMSINDNPESAAIVNAIARLGDSLSMQVTAEGIEDAAIEQRLKTMGCHTGQGWHFGRPTSIGATRALLASKNLLPAYRAEIVTDLPEVEPGLASPVLRQLG